MRRVVARFLTWKPELTAETRAYCDAVRAHLLVAAWARCGGRGSRRNGWSPSATKPRHELHATALDHVGVVGHDVAVVLAAEFSASASASASPRWRGTQAAAPAIAT